MGRLPSNRCVDHQLDLAGADRIFNVGPAFMHLEHRFHAQACIRKPAGGAFSGHQAEAHLSQALGHGQQGGFVAVVGGEKHRAAGGQRFTRAEFGLGVSQAEAGGRAHHFTRAAHLRAEQRISAGEALERQHRFLHRLQRRHRFGRQADLLEGLARHDPAGDLGQRSAGGLGHKWHGARSTRVGFDDEHEAILHGELQVDQAVHVERQGQRFTPLANRGQGLLLQAHRRQGAGGITGMHTGGLDVLHQAADHHAAGGIAEGIHIHLGGIFQVLVDQHGVIGLHVHRFHHVAVELLLAVDHLHGTSAQHIARADHHGIAHALGDHARFSFAAGQAVAGLADVELAQDRLKLFAVFGCVDRFGRGAPDAGAGGLAGGGFEPTQQRDCQLERRLPTELHDHALGLFGLDHVEHVFKGERLEVEAIGGVVIGRHRFGVGVHHHRGEALGLQCEGGVHTAVIELDALADAVGTAAQDHHLAAGFRLHLAFGSDQLKRAVIAQPLHRPLIGGVVIGGGGGEFGSAGVHGF